MKLSTKLLFLLLFIDLIFIILHVLYSFDILDNKNFKTSRDGGYGEIYQYFKYLSSAIILLILAGLHQSILCILWAALSIFLFFDDWIKIHELVGGKMLGGIMKPYIDGAYHQGQMVYGFIVGGIILVIGRYFWKTASQDVKALSFTLFLALGLLWFSAVIIDYIHAIWVTKEYNLIGVLLEEGGEHLAMSLFLWLNFRALILKTNYKF